MGREKYRPGSQHPEEYRRDLNPDALEGENRPEPLPTRPAAEIKAVAQAHPELSDDELRQIPVVVAGARLEQGATYLDLKRHRPIEFTAAGAMAADSEHWYVPKSQVHYELWNRLTGVEPRGY
jgi:hypothetical protein